MKAKPRLVSSFDELMASRYGHVPKRLLREPDSLEGLLASYYGAPQRKKHPRKKATPAVSLSFGCDDGTMILAQRSRPANGNGSYPPAQAAPVTSPPGTAPIAPPATEASPPAPAPAAAAPVPAPASQAEILPPLRNGATAGAAGSDAQPKSGTSSRRTVGIPSEADFLADIKSIVTGQSVYDPAQQKTVPKSGLQEYPREGDRAPENSNGRSPAPSDNQAAIFDRIAKSMQYAGAYDLGSVELENRFSDFDRMDDLSRHKPKATPQPVPPAAADKAPPAVPEPPVADNSDFIQDLDAIKRQADAVAAQPPVTPAPAQPSVTSAPMQPPVMPAPAQSPLAQESSIPPGYSAPLYDTGEHVLPGEDLYRNQLRVGRAPSVPFSYGQIIAMADLFKDVDEMMAESPTVLQNLKRLIEQSTAYYKGNKAPSLPDVPNEAWEQATGGRYLRLAENNYDHFAPNLLFQNAQFARTANRYSNHKRAWEEHHAKAIAEAQKRMRDPTLANPPYIQNLPLIINAFGDHFLTDAFAAGHVINKEEVIKYFKSMFYSGQALRPEGNAFFDRVARQAWHGEVSRRFERLETAEPLDRWWNVFGWHPNVTNADRFATVLKGVAAQAQDKVANIAVKAIHDRLNRDGIQVTNGASTQPWRLTGDGYLTQETLAVMKQAVAQSAANVIDPAIVADNFSMSDYFAKVWLYVPQLTPASEATVRTLVTEYVNPTSQRLVDAAADIINREVSSLIKALLDARALRVA